MAYKKQLEDAQKQLLRLEKQKMGIERKMRGLIQVVEGLRVLTEPTALSDPPTSLEASVDPETPSLPTKVLEVLANVAEPIGATQIRDQLILNRAVNASTKNLLINIHTTLKRLIKARQVEEVLLSDESKMYIYVSPLQRALKHGTPNSLANTIPRTR